MKKVKTSMIERTPEVVALIERWEHITKNYIPSAEEESIFKVLPKLSEWEKVLLYAMSDPQYKTVKNVAALLQFPQTRTYRVMLTLRQKVKSLLKDE